MVLIHLSPRESLGAKDGVLVKAIFLKEYEGFNIENVKKANAKIIFSRGQEGRYFCPQPLRVSCMTVLLVL